MGRRLTFVQLNPDLDHDLKLGKETRVVNTRGRRNVVLMGRKVILIDPRDGVSEIDLKKMDARSPRLLDRTV